MLSIHEVGEAGTTARQGTVDWLLVLMKHTVCVTARLEDIM